jgi:hypothetical protein
MRCDGKPVRPGTGTTHPMSKASEPDKQNRTLFADSIRASSLNRLHQKAGQKTAPDLRQHVNLPLATREPSTEDIRACGQHVRNGPIRDSCTAAMTTVIWLPLVGAGESLTLKNERPTCSKVGKSANLQRKKATRAIAVREGFGWWPRHSNIPRNLVLRRLTAIRCRSCFCAMP